MSSEKKNNIVSVSYTEEVGDEIKDEFLKCIFVERGKKKRSMVNSIKDFEISVKISDVNY